MGRYFLPRKVEESGLEATRQETIPQIYKTGPIKAILTLQLDKNKNKNLLYYSHHPSGP